MKNFALSIFEDTSFDVLIPKIQEKITGKKNSYHFMSFDNQFKFLFYELPTPFMIVLAGIIKGTYDFEILTHQKSESVLRHLATLNDADFKEFMNKMHAKIQKQSALYAMQCHIWNDSYALLAQKDNPFLPVFVPHKIIDCKGIKAIQEDPCVKTHILETVNVHLNLSPQKRADMMESFSIVRPITEIDCKQDNVSPFLIGQQGVFARIDLPKYFFLGFYSGIYFDNPSKSDAYFDAIGHGIDIYLFGHEGQARPLVSAYRGGNRISLINSATDYTGTAKEIAHQLFFVQNTLPIDFKTDNNPDNEIRNTKNMFDISGYLTIRPVKAGEQLYVDYGYDYWKSKHHIMPSVQEIDNAYLALKEKHN